MFTDLITTYGYHHGPGPTDPTGGVHGDRWYIMTIMHTGDLSEGIIPYAIHTGFRTPIIIFTDLIDTHL